jgi:hypothetical protein
MQQLSLLVALFMLPAKKATFPRSSVQLAFRPVNRFDSLGAHLALGPLLAGYPMSKAFSIPQYTPCSSMLL